MCVETYIKESEHCERKCVKSVAGHNMLDDNVAISSIHYLLSVITDELWSRTTDRNLTEVLFTFTP